MLHQWVIFLLWLWAFHTQHTLSALPSLSATFVFSLSLALPSTATCWQFNGRLWSKDEKQKKKRKTREGIKKNGIWKTHSVITWFTRHLRLSLRVFCFSLSFYYIFHFFFFLSDFAICQWNCLSTRCELKIWWWFNKTQFAPKECEVRKREKLNSSDGLCN